MNEKKERKQEHIPAELTALLNEQGIAKGEILIAARTDRNLTCAFARGYLFLTKQELFVAEAEVRPGETHYYKGVENLLKLEQAEKRKWSLNRYALADMKRLRIERTVAGGFLVAIAPNPADGKMDGEAKTVAAFSNQCIGAVTRIERAAGSLLKGKEPDPEVLEDKEKDAYCPKCGTMYPDPERKICPKCMDKRAIFERMLGYLKPFRVRILVMFLCYLATACLNLAWPYLSGYVLYDRVLKKDETFVEFLKLPAGSFITALVIVGGVMILARITLQLMGIIQGRMAAAIVPELVCKLKTDIFTSMGQLSISFFTSKQTGSLMTRVISDSEEVLGFFIDGLPYFLINVFTIIATAAVMFRMSPLLAVAALVFMPVTFFISWRMMPRLWHRYGKQHRATRSLNAKVNDNLNGARVVKAFGQEQSEVSRFDTSNERVRSADMEVVAYDNRFWGMYNASENMALLLVWVIGAYLVLQTHSIELGVLLTFTGYVTQLNGPMDFMSFFFRWYTQCMNIGQRMFEIMDAVPEITEKKDAIHLTDIRGDVELRNVTFGYEKHKPVLKNVSLKAEAGKMLGIVGRSGAGKTTIVNLISRLYDPQEGEVFLDGINLKDLSFETLRGNVAMVSQETYVFMGTVAENIAYAKKDAARAEIVRAAVLASAHDFICKMPDGYDTMIGSAGRTLSGGERQRISIARAILANPKILILDEATAAVDTETEQAIQASINMLIKDRTTISIAHRLSTLRDADHLLVIDDGKVTEEGTHEELVAKKGTYYKLKELQTKALALKGIE